MDIPTNAAYGKKEVPQNPGEKIKVFGMIFPKKDGWKIGLIIGLVLFFAILFILTTMPTGLSFLAARDAGGFFSFIGLFTGYMLGFLLMLGIFFGIVVGILYAVHKSLSA